jgi:hypothetical protein
MEVRIMNGIKKKIMCLALSIAFVGVSSQAQAELTTAAKGVCMIFKAWELFGWFSNIEKCQAFDQKQISAVTLSFAIERNMALGRGDDISLGIFTIAEAVSGNKLPLERVVEGVSYIGKGLRLTDNHNWYIGWSKILTLEYYEYDVSSQSIFYPKTVTLQDCKDEWAKTCKLSESILEISPLYHTHRSLFYVFKGSNKIVESSSAIFLDKVDPSGFITLNRGVRRFIYDASLGLLYTPNPILVPVFFGVCQFRLVDDLTSGVTSNDPGILISNTNERLTLEIFRHGQSKFKEATKLNLEETGNIVKAVSLYRSAFKCYKDCLSMLEDTQKKKRLRCQHKSLVCLKEIKSLMVRLKNEVFKILSDEPDDQKNSPIYYKCMSRISSAEDDIQIKDALIEYKIGKPQRFYWLRRIFSSNNDQLEQLIGQL